MPSVYHMSARIDVRSERSDAWGMRRLAMILAMISGMLSTACTARHIVPPEPPLPSAQMAELSGLQVSVTSFSISGGVQEDTEHDRIMMRQRFVDFLSSRA